MDKSIAYIINSAPEVGKTTLLNNLHAILPDVFALLDGYNLGKTTPYENEDLTLYITTHISAGEATGIVTDYITGRITYEAD